MKVAVISLLLLTNLLAYEKGDRISDDGDDGRGNRNANGGGGSYCSSDDGGDGGAGGGYGTAGGDTKTDYSAQGTPSPEEGGYIVGMTNLSKMLLTCVNFCISVLLLTSVGCAVKTNSIFKFFAV